MGRQAALAITARFLAAAIPEHAEGFIDRPVRRRLTGPSCGFLTTGEIMSDKVHYDEGRDRSSSPSSGVTVTCPRVGRRRLPGCSRASILTCKTVLDIGCWRRGHHGRSGSSSWRRAGDRHRRRKPMSARQRASAIGATGLVGQDRDYPGRAGAVPDTATPVSTSSSAGIRSSISRTRNGWRARPSGCCAPAAGSSPRTG